MMKILKHGNIEKRKLTKLFICPDCGCEFEADDREYHKILNEHKEITFAVKCPDCRYEVKYHCQEQWRN